MLDDLEDFFYKFSEPIPSFCRQTEFMSCVDEQGLGEKESQIMQNNEDYFYYLSREVDGKVMFRNGSYFCSNTIRFYHSFVRCDNHHAELSKIYDGIFLMSANKADFKDAKERMQTFNDLDFGEIDESDIF